MPTLLPHQQEAVSYLASLKPSRAILADDIGLGKTATSIAWAETVTGSTALTPKILVVCPKSLIPQWQSEVERFAQNPYAFAYINYESLHKVNFFPTTMICDEATAIKSPTAKRTQLTVHFAKHCQNVLFLTATPIRNNEADLFTMFYCLPYSFLQSSHSGDPATDLVRSYKDFVAAYFHVRRINIDGRTIEKVSGIKSSGRQILSELLETRIVRRTKALLNLPPFSREYMAVNFAPGQEAIYNDVLSDIIRMEDDETKEIPNFLARMTRLRQAVLSPSLFGGKAVSGKLDWLKENVPNLSRPCLIFTNYAQFAKLVHDSFPGSVLLIGEMDSSTRQASISAFMEGRSDVFILSASAGGFGLNLQRAEVVIWTDLPWTPDVWQQGTGRAHRQGQENPVHEIVLGIPRTVDRVIVELLRSKKKCASEVDAMIYVADRLRKMNQERSA